MKIKKKIKETKPKVDKLVDLFYKLMSNESYGKT